MNVVKDNPNLASFHFRTRNSEYIFTRDFFKEKELGNTYLSGMIGMITKVNSYNGKPEAIYDENERFVIQNASVGSALKATCISNDFKLTTSTVQSIDEIMFQKDNISKDDWNR